MFPQIPLTRALLPVGLNVIYPPNQLLNTFSVFDSICERAAASQCSAETRLTCSRHLSTLAPSQQTGSQGAPQPPREDRGCRISDSDGVSSTLQHCKPNSFAFFVPTLASSLITVHFHGHQNSSNSSERHQVVGECLLF